MVGVVMRAEEEVGGAGEEDAYIRLRTASVAQIGGVERLRRGHRSGQVASLPSCGPAPGVGRPCIVVCSLLTLHWANPALIPRQCYPCRANQCITTPGRTPLFPPAVAYAVGEQPAWCLGPARNSPDRKCVAPGRPARPAARRRRAVRGGR